MPLGPSKLWWTVGVVQGPRATLVNLPLLYDEVCIQPHSPLLHFTLRMLVMELEDNGWSSASHTMESSSFAPKLPPPPPAPVLWYRGLPIFSWGSAFIGSSSTNYQLLEMLISYGFLGKSSLSAEMLSFIFYHKSNRNFPASEAMKRIFKMLLMPANLYFPLLLNIVYKLLATPVSLFINIEEPFALVSTPDVSGSMQSVLLWCFLSSAHCVSLVSFQIDKSSLISFLNVWIHPTYPAIICWEAFWFSHFLPLQKSLLSVIEHFLIYY